MTEAHRHIRSILRFAAIFSLCLAVASAADPKPVSEFTTTNQKHVKVLEDSAREKNPEIDHFKYLCPGLGGYQVIFTGLDARSWINLMIDEHTVDLHYTTLTACSGCFPNKADDVVEWRGFCKGNSFLPYAIIYRMASSSDHGKRAFETFIIIKLAGKNSKVVAHVPGKEGNEKAESVADKLCSR